MQLMRGTGRIESRQQEISQISRSLKALAKELDLPVIALSQLSRAVEGRTDQKPKLADLRESGAIEQDADQVLFIYRPEQAGITEVDGRSSEGMAQVLIEKNRNGPTDSISLMFVKEFTLFRSLSLREESGGLLAGGRLDRATGRPGAGPDLPAGPGDTPGRARDPWSCPACGACAASWWPR